MMHIAAAQGAGRKTVLRAVLPLRGYPAQAESAFSRVHQQKGA